MKRAFLILWIVLMARAAQAVDVWKSSNTTTATPFAALCTGNQRGYLHSVCTSFGVAASSVTVYGSSWTVSTTSIIGPISTNVADQCKEYNTNLGKGLGYQKTNAAVVTILYECN